MNDFALIMILLAIVVIGIYCIDMVTKYISMMEKSLCAPKMILPNGTKICK